MNKKVLCIYFTILLARPLLFRLLALLVHVLHSNREGPLEELKDFLGNRFPNQIWNHSHNRGRLAAAGCRARAWIHRVGSFHCKCEQILSRQDSSRQLIPNVFSISSGNVHIPFCLPVLQFSRPTEILLWKHPGRDLSSGARRDRPVQFSSSPLLHPSLQESSVKKKKDIRFQASYAPLYLLKECFD